MQKHINKSVRRENTDAQIATNEAIATAKKFQKLLGTFTPDGPFFSHVLADQQAKIVVARSTYASLKVGLHSYEQKYVDCTREIAVCFKEGIKETDTVRFDAQIESLGELLAAEHEKLHVIGEEVEDLEALAEDLRFDCRAIKYELAQQNGDNRRTKRVSGGSC